MATPLDTITSRGLNRDARNNTATVSSMAQIPRINTSAVAPFSLKGSIVQDRTNCLLYHSILTPGIGYEWVEIHDENSLLRTVSVGTSAGSDYATLQLALADNIGKVPALIVNVEIGDYDQSTLLDIDLGSVTRFVRIQAASAFEAGGVSYIHNANVNASPTVDGIITLAGAGTATATVTGTGGDPDFGALGVGAGDVILAWDGAATNTVVSLTVASASSNTITVTGLFPAGLASTGNGFVILPRVRFFNMATALNDINGDSQCTVEFQDIHFDMGRVGVLNAPLSTGDPLESSSDLTSRFSRCVFEGGLNVQRGARIRLESSSIIKDDPVALNIEKNADISVTTLGVIQSAVSTGILVSIQVGSRAVLEELSMVSVDGRMTITDSSLCSMLVPFLVTKGTASVAQGLLEGLNSSSIHISPLNRIEQLSDNSQDLSVLIDTSSMVHIRAGLISAPAAAVATVQTSSGSTTSVVGSVVDKAGAAVLTLSTDLGTVRMSGATTTTGGTIDAIGLNGGASGSVVIAAGPIVGGTAGLLGATTAGSAWVSGV